MDHNNLYVLCKILGKKKHTSIAGGYALFTDNADSSHLPAPVVTTQFPNDALCGGYIFRHAPGRRRTLPRQLEANNVSLYLRSNRAANRAEFLKTVFRPTFWHLNYFF